VEGFLLSRLASLKFALVVVLLIALACVAGTLIPQGDQVSSYLTRHPEASRLLAVLSTLGLTRVYYSWWFVFLLFAFAASLAACTIRRYTLIRQSTGTGRIRLIGSIITHVSLMLVLTGGLVRVLWGQKGVIVLREGEVARHVKRGDGAPIELPFSVRLVKFELEFHESAPPPTATDRLYVRWPDKNLQADFPLTLNVEHPVVPADAKPGAEPAFKVSIRRYLPDFALDGSSGEATSRSEAPNNPAVLVSVAGGGGTNTQWVFARFPDFKNPSGTGEAAAAQPLQFRFESAQSVTAKRGPRPIKAFKSTLEFLEGDDVVRTKTIAVNSPFAYRRYTFYQLSYDPNDLSWSTLQVVKDPGVPIVYCGFILMMAGLTTVFCVGPWLGSKGQTKGGVYDHAV
jgi:cytochrome c biogenesis protein ResB